MSYDIFPGDAKDPRVPGEMVDFTQFDGTSSHGGIRLVSEKIESYYQDGDPDSMDVAVRTLRGMDEHLPDQYARAMLYAAYVPVIDERAAGTLPDFLPLFRTEHNLEVALKTVRSTLHSLHGHINHSIPESDPWIVLKTIEADVLETGLVIATGKLSVDRALQDIERESEPDGVLFASASRERNPAYYHDLHELHTYNPEDPSSRTRVHVTSGRKKEDEFGDSGLRYDILEATRDAYLTAKPRGKNIAKTLSTDDVLDIISARPDWNPSRLPNANLVRTIMADKLYDLIATAEQDESLLTTSFLDLPDIQVA